MSLLAKAVHGKILSDDDILKRKTRKSNDGQNAIRSAKKVQNEVRNIKPKGKKKKSVKQLFFSGLSLVPGIAIAIFLFFMIIL